MQHISNVSYSSRNRITNQKNFLFQQNFVVCNRVAWKAVWKKWTWGMLVDAQPNMSSVPRKANGILAKGDLITLYQPLKAGCSEVWDVLCSEVRAIG